MKFEMITKMYGKEKNLIFFDTEKNDEYLTMLIEDDLIGMVSKDDIKRMTKAL
jgi:hypothetical protein